MLSKCKWLTIDSMVSLRSLSIIHNTLKNKNCPSLYNMFRIKDNNREVTNITTKYIPKTEKSKKFFIYKYIGIYNKLDTYITKKSNKEFKKEMKLIYLYNPVHDSYD